MERSGRLRKKMSGSEAGSADLLQPERVQQILVFPYLVYFRLQTEIDIGYRMEYNAISSEPDKSGQSPRRCVWSRFVNGEHG